MPQFAANLSMLFTEIPFMDRFAGLGWLEALGGCPCERLLKNIQQKALT